MAYQLGAAEYALRVTGARDAIAQVQNLGRQVTGLINPFNTLGRLISSVIGGAAVGSLVSLSARMEDTRVSFESFFKTAQETEAFLKRLRKWADFTPMSEEQTYGAARMLLSFNRAAKDIIKDMQMLGDVAAGTQRSLTELAYSYGRMSRSQRIYNMDLKLLNMKGVPIYEALAKVLKTNENNVQVFASQGKINFKHIQQAFEDMTSAGGKYHKFMYKLSTTLKSWWLGFTDVLSTNILRPFGDAIVEGLKLKETLSGIVEGMKKLAESNAFKDAVTTLRRMLEFVSKNAAAIFTFAKRLAIAYVAIKSLAVGLGVLKGFALLFVGLTKLVLAKGLILGIGSALLSWPLPALALGLYAVLRHLSKLRGLSIGEMIDSWGTNLWKFIKVVYSMLPDFAEDWKNVWDDITGYIEFVFTNLLAKIKNFFADAINELVAGWNLLVDAFPALKIQRAVAATQQAALSPTFQPKSRLWSEMQRRMQGDDPTRDMERTLGHGDLWERWGRMFGDNLRSALWVERTPATRTSLTNPADGTSASGTPASGTSASGTSASGTSASGTSAGRGLPDIPTASSGSAALAGLTRLGRALEEGLGIADLAQQFEDSLAGIYHNMAILAGQGGELERLQRTPFDAVIDYGVDALDRLTGGRASGLSANFVDALTRDATPAVAHALRASGLSDALTRDATPAVIDDLDRLTGDRASGLIAAAEAGGDPRNYTGGGWNPPIAALFKPLFKPLGFSGPSDELKAELAELADEFERSTSYVRLGMFQLRRAMDDARAEDAILADRMAELDRNLDDLNQGVGRFSNEVDYLGVRAGILRRRTRELLDLVEESRVPPELLQAAAEGRRQQQDVAARLTRIAAYREETETKVQEAYRKALYDIYAGLERPVTTSPETTPDKLSERVAARRARREGLGPRSDATRLADNLLGAYGPTAARNRFYSPGLRPGETRLQQEGLGFGGQTRYGWGGSAAQSRTRTPSSLTPAEQESRENHLREINDLFAQLDRERMAPRFYRMSGWMHAATEEAKKQESTNRLLNNMYHSRSQELRDQAAASWDRYQAERAQRNLPQDSFTKEYWTAIKARQTTMSDTDKALQQMGKRFKTLKLNTQDASKTFHSFMFIAKSIDDLDPFGEFTGSKAREVQVRFNRLVGTINTLRRSSGLTENNFKRLQRTMGDTAGEGFADALKEVLGISAGEDSDRLLRAKLRDRKSPVTWAQVQEAIELQGKKYTEEQEKRKERELGPEAAAARRKTAIARIAARFGLSPEYTKRILEDPAETEYLVRDLGGLDAVKEEETRLKDQETKRRERRDALEARRQGVHRNAVLGRPGAQEGGWAFGGISNVQVGSTLGRLGANMQGAAKSKEEQMLQSQNRLAGSLDGLSGKLKPDASGALPIHIKNAGEFAAVQPGE